VELAPPLLPARLDVLDTSICRRLVVGVRGQLQLSVAVALLEASRESLEPPGSCLLRALERDADRDALQRNALFSLSKKRSRWA
jgi:hypothetical protein